MLHAQCGVYIVVAATAACGKEPRRSESRAARERFPGGVGEWIRNPGIAAIGIVFDDHKAPAWLEIAAHEAQHALFVALEVERVGHDDTIQRRQIERTGEVSGPVVDVNIREAGSHGSA